MISGLGPLSLEEFTSTGEYASLLLVILSLIALAVSAAKIRTLRSFQVEIFIFGVVLFLAEVPHILETLNVISMESLDAAGLVVHSVSMVVLSIFVALRVYGFLRRK